jgi:outer membrane protein OmpA-like peptidoglycan-associated protein
MKKTFVVLIGLATLVSGCAATRGWVRRQQEPIQTQVSQVEQQNTRQEQAITQAQQGVERNTTAIAATDEKASAADRRAGEAMTRATTADQKGDQNSQQIAGLRQTLANFDNYKVVHEATVLFDFNSATLKPEDKQALDDLIGRTGQLKRYFIAIEGYTDPTGDAAYNLELSKRRAEGVVQYLAGEKDVDFNRIHTIGLGEQKLVNTETTRDGRAQNRRVEVKIYSADDALATTSATGSN